MRTRKLLAPVAAGLVAVSMTACGSNSSKTTTNTSSLSSTASSYNQQDPSSLKQGGNLNLAIGSLADNWNPMNTLGNQRDFTDVREPLSARFFDFDDKGQATVDHTWLDDASATTTNGQTVATFKLNPKAAWNDGTKMGLADFVATWKACDGSNTKFNCATTEGYDQIQKIEQGADANTIVVTYKKTYPDWQANFSGGPARAASVKDAATFNNGWSTINNAWFSGPYIVKSIDKTNQTVTEVPNPNWWGAKPKLDQIVFKVYSDDATAQAYANGQIDAFDIGVNAAHYKIAQSVQGGEIRRAAGPNWRHITFNTASPSYKDVAVRRAIVQYLDRAQMAKSDLAGMNWETTPLNNTVFMQNQAQYVDMAEATGLKFDKTAGDKTLTDAGYAKGSDGMWAKGGKPLTVHISQIDGVAVSVNEATQYQNQLKADGINVVIDHLTQQNWGDKLSAKAFDAVVFTWVGTDFPYPAANQYYNSKSGSNYSNLKDSKVDQLVSEISTESDQTKRNDLVKQVETIVWNNPQILPLYQRPDQWAVKKTLANYGAMGLASRTWENIGWMNS